MRPNHTAWILTAAALMVATACDDNNSVTDPGGTGGIPATGGTSGTPGSGGAGGLDPSLVERGKDIFRNDTFGDEALWTDTLELHTVIAAAVDPLTALAVGLKVDATALPEGILDTVDL